MTGKNFIGYSLSAEGSTYFHTLNPRSGKRLDVDFAEATIDEVDRAVELAFSSFSEFNDLLPERRAEFLTAIADEIELIGKDLIQVFCFESGLSEQRAITERKRTVFQLRSFSKALIQGDWLQASIDLADPNFDPPKPDLRKMMTGVGPVVVFGASNFPLAYSTAGGDTASALAAGCPVIVKSHPLHAGTGSLVSEAIVRAAKKTRMPEGVFSNLNAKSFSVGQHLVMHPHIKAVGFTGSLLGGRAIFDLAASRKEPIPVFAEMGSTNPVLIFQSSLASNAEKIAELLASSITSGAGQFCTKPGIILMEDAEFSDVFIQRLGQQIIEAEQHVMLHSSIKDRFDADQLKSRNVSYLEVFETEQNQGLNIGQHSLKVVDVPTFIEESILQEEVFGPFAILVRCNGIDEMERCLDLINGSLTISVFAEAGSNLQMLQKLKKKAGRLIYNGVPTGVTVCPSMNHGGPYPATTDSRFTAVGIDAMKRFLRPVSFQNFPQELLPLALKDFNELGISRRINGKLEIH